FQLLHPDLGTDFPRLRSLDTFRTNLPRRVTSFVGRERETVEVKRQLSNSALVTLTGAGGCGKTRLAIQVAADLLKTFAGGVWFVEFAALSDPTLVASAVASVLGVRGERDRPLTTLLVDTLKPKASLLVVDNCEHLLGVCAELVAALLRGCPKLRILA